MHVAQILAQSAEVAEAGAGTWVVWIGFAAVVGVLWWMIRNTRQRAYSDFQERQQRAQELRDNDPDLAKPDDGGRSED